MEDYGKGLGNNIKPGDVYSTPDGGKTVKVLPIRPNREGEMYVERRDSKKQSSNVPIEVISRRRLAVKNAMDGVTEQLSEGREFQGEMGEESGDGDSESTGSGARKRKKAKQDKQEAGRDESVEKRRVGRRALEMETDLLEDDISRYLDALRKYSDGFSEGSEEKKGIQDMIDRAQRIAEEDLTKKERYRTLFAAKEELSKRVTGTPASEIYEALFALDEVQAHLEVLLSEAQDRTDTSQEDVVLNESDLREWIGRANRLMEEAKNHTNPEDFRESAIALSLLRDEIAEKMQVSTDNFQRIRLQPLHPLDLGIELSEKGVESKKPDEVGPRKKGTSKRTVPSKRINTDGKAQNDGTKSRSGRDEGKHEAGLRRLYGEIGEVMKVYARCIEIITSLPANVSQEDKQTLQTEIWQLHERLAPIPESEGSLAGKFKEVGVIGDHLESIRVALARAQEEATGTQDIVKIIVTDQKKPRKERAVRKGGERSELDKTFREAFQEMRSAYDVLLRGKGPGLKAIAARYDQLFKKAQSDGASKELLGEIQSLTEEMKGILETAAVSSETKKAQGKRGIEAKTEDWERLTGTVFNFPIKVGSIIEERNPAPDTRVKRRFVITAILDKGKIVEMKEEGVNENVTMTVTAATPKTSYVLVPEALGKPAQRGEIIGEAPGIQEIPEGGALISLAGRVFEVQHGMAPEVIRVLAGGLKTAIDQYLGALDPAIRAARASGSTVLLTRIEAGAVEIAAGGIKRLFPSADEAQEAQLFDFCRAYISEAISGSRVESPKRITADEQ